MSDSNVLFFTNKEKYERELSRIKARSAEEDIYCFYDKNSKVLYTNKGRLDKFTLSRYLTGKDSIDVNFKDFLKTYEITSLGRVSSFIFSTLTISGLSIGYGISAFHFAAASTLIYAPFMIIGAIAGTIMLGIVWDYFLNNPNSSENMRLLAIGGGTLFGASIGGIIGSCILGPGLGTLIGLGAGAAVGFAVHFVLACIDKVYKEHNLLDDKTLEELFDKEASEEDSSLSGKAM